MELILIRNNMDNIEDRIKAQKHQDDCDPSKCVLCGKDATHFYPHYLCNLSTIPI